ncbi:MAG TPA: hypothetical protein VFM18_08740 [Methanosarcina sp.]|nr:hypothetical protein [Methanosarcina sp.]
MSYVTPSVLVYQQLASSGGVTNATPDLDVVIVGPCYNVLEYDGTSASSLTQTAALTVAGSAYQIVDNTINNVVIIPGQLPGQDIEEASVEVYFNNALVESLSTKFSGSSSTDRITILDATGSATASAASALLTGVTNVVNFAIGDSVTVTGAGLAGANLTATILAIDSGTNTVTLDTAASTSNVAATVTKSPVSNTNPVTATKVVEPGDGVIVTYVTGGVTKVFTTTVSEVETVAGVLVAIGLSDILPSDVSGNLQVSVRKSFNNQLVLKTINSYVNYDDSTVGADGKITIKPHPKLAYGTVITADVHVAYRALRQDLSGSIIDIGTVGDIQGALGVISDRNPLALGVNIAAANTVGRVLAVAVPRNDLIGYQAALDLLEGRRVYSVIPLTTDSSITQAVATHVTQMSTPEMASWRVAAVSMDIPTVQDVGQYSVTNVNANGGNNTITLVDSRYILTSSNSTFLSDGVLPGDTVNITAGSGSPSPIGTVKVLQVMNNQQIQVSAAGTATGVSFYITRILTKAQQAAAVAAMATTLKNNRAMLIPQTAGISINGVVTYLPGYYLACAIGGLISGLPVQQSLTNVGLAGISDIQYGNFYFTRAQLATMAAAGTCLVVQETQSSIPYVRHSLTTDMSVLYTREIQQVKNWDYLSYYFYDVIKSFIGKYNITPDSLRTLGQTITAGGRLLQGKKLARLGAPLLDFSIKTLKQDSTNKDTVIVEMPILMPVVMNYANLYLIV